MVTLVFRAEQTEKRINVHSTWDGRRHGRRLFV